MTAILWEVTRFLAVLFLLMFTAWIVSVLGLFSYYSIKIIRSQFKKRSDN